MTEPHSWRQEQSWIGVVVGVVEEGPGQGVGGVEPIRRGYARTKKQSVSAFKAKSVDALAPQSARSARGG